MYNDQLVYTFEHCLELVYEKKYLKKRFMNSEGSFNQFDHPL